MSEEVMEAVERVVSDWIMSDMNLCRWCCKPIDLADSTVCRAYYSPKIPEVPPMCVIIEYEEVGTKKVVVIPVSDEGELYIRCDLTEPSISAGEWMDIIVGTKFGQYTYEQVCEHIEEAMLTDVMWHVEDLF